VWSSACSDLQVQQRRYRYRTGEAQELSGLWKVSLATLLNYPLIVFVITFAVLWAAALIGDKAGQKRRMNEDQQSDFSIVTAATLTLLGLIIGFSFSMATGRYDQRKNYEEEEANAIGTEFVRVDMLSEAERAQVKSLLRQYTDLRIQLYTSSYADDITPIQQKTAQLQDQMWTAVAKVVSGQQTPVMSQVMTGMNDVLNSQGYAQAARWNRIPIGAWYLMFGTAVLCNLLLGFGLKTFNPKVLLILPLVVALAFFLIADIDSPRGGVIRVVPQNLMALRNGLK
jgi:hypothetical protein